MKYCGILVDDVFPDAEIRRERYMGSGWGKWVEIPQLIAKRWREFPLFELRFSPIFRQIKNRRICFGHDT